MLPSGTCLVEDAAIVWGDIVGVEEEAFLHWALSVILSVMTSVQWIGTRFLHRLKLVTGVDISTRPVRRTGREGNVKKSMSLRAAAEVKRTPFRRSMTMFNGMKCNSSTVLSTVYQCQA